MRYLALGGFAFLAVWLQTCFFGWFSIRGAQPDLLLTLVIFLALYSEDEDWPIRFWLVGLVKDLFSSNALGLHALAFALLGVGISKIRKEIFRDDFRTRALVVFAACCLANGSIAMIESFRLGALHFHDLSVRIFLEAAYSGMLAPCFFWILMVCRSLFGIRTSPDFSRAL
ncbi:MAG: rod shape-determining protein MreD [Planctomycetota bacterium]|nr:rod shape-determining protein MreD [Planctomycetota bacterium]